MALSPFLDLVPMLMCADVPASVRFYRNVLGFEVVDRMDDVGSTGFASLRNGAAQIMLASPSYIPRAPTIEGRHPQSAYYFYVEDADALRAAVVAAGWPATECVDRFYGLREFEVVDPEGHVLLFGQDIDSMEDTTVKYTAAIDAAHQRLFRLMGIDPDTGSGSTSGDRKFAGYPYVGAEYGTEHRVRKLLVVGLDAGHDQNPGGGPTRDTGQFEQAITDPDINPHMAGVCFTALRYAFPPDWGWSLVETRQETCQRLLKRGWGLILKELKGNPLQYIAFTNFYKWVTKGRTDRGGGQDRVHFNRRFEINLFHEEVRILQPDIVVFQGTDFRKPAFTDTRSFVEGIADCYVVRHPAYRGRRTPRDIVKPLYEVLCNPRPSAPS